MMKEIGTGIKSSKFIFFFKKSFSFFKVLSFSDFNRKVIFFLLFHLWSKWLFLNLKGLYYFKNNSIKLRHGVKIYGLSMDIRVGNNIEIFDNAIFEFGSASIVRIGDNFILSYGGIFCCQKKITIGNDVQIGEYTSIRDTTHSHSRKFDSMRFANDSSLEILIGNNVWIGRGCIILPGTIIEDGVVVGANSIIKGILKSNWIYAGNPLKPIKLRS